MRRLLLLLLIASCLIAVPPASAQSAQAVAAGQEPLADCSRGDSLGRTRLPRLDSIAELNGRGDTAFVKLVSRETGQSRIETWVIDSRGHLVEFKSRKVIYDREQVRCSNWLQGLHMEEGVREMEMIHQLPKAPELAASGVESVAQLSAFPQYVRRSRDRR